MAAEQPEADHSTSKEEFLDLYSDLDENEDLKRTAEANELFDAVLTGSVDKDKKHTTNASSSRGKGKAVKKDVKPEEEEYASKHNDQHREVALYIGNFPWWTTDTDIIAMAQTLSVRDIAHIKFAENKVNGQSRGYAKVVVMSQESMKILLEKIPLCTLHGERMDCRFATRQNLNVFEGVANKRIPMRGQSKDSDSTENIPSLLSQETRPNTAAPPPFPTLPFTSNSFQTPSPFLVQPPPLFPTFPPPPFLPACPPYVPSQPPSSLHINPAFVNPTQDRNSSNAYSHQNPTSQRTDVDFQELMNRNQAIASGAITKAMSGATTGDLRVAMETLLTAIAIIKQSRVYRDDRCQALVTSLKDCLVSIQGKYGYRSNSSGDRDRDRGRDRVRDRDCDRDRNRRWDREDSSGWEGPRTSRRHRERSWSGERNKERSREWDRHRDERDRHR